MSLGISIVPDGPGGVIQPVQYLIEFQTVESVEQSSSPATGRFHTIILYGPECAWDPDNQVKNFVAHTLTYSGYDLETSA